MVEVVGFKPTRTTLATEMEQFHRKCDIVYAGDHAGILLPGIRRDDVQRGQVLATPGTIQAHSRFRADLYLPTRREDGSDNPDLSDPIYSFLFRYADVPGTLQLEGSSPVRAGEIARFSAELETPVAMEVGLRFALRKGGNTLGMGVVTEILS